ncbi:beta-galactosidase [Paenibacillus sp. R14(2021)]|uniref:beta-galactosidase n=1 Tax=Paenibacillus sp. R14(2021) TaxID=2859228 RepID=UPI001C6168AE|nr:beta-galactosidase [Paenibacillus sp. R14(2021)]
MDPMPHLKRENGITTLIVDGQPFTVLGGEIHNSSSSSLAYMDEKVWPYLRGLHLNTVIVPVFWELAEPVEDMFDFELVDGIVQRAREEGLRLVLLWFGLWKNGLSSYAPAWVKRDYDTYFRARYPDGAASETISPLCDAAVQADARAFGRFMKHLGEIDGDRRTVIMIQVENEVGFLGAERDYSEPANERFEGQVPAEIAQAFGTAGTWREAFGEQAGETFMAYHYARAVEAIASAGSQAYPLPMIVNAWLDQYPNRPGAYPSGGPSAKMIGVWRIGAPSIAVYAPDIYLPNFREICETYARDGNPLFIPEARRDTVSAANVFCAIGSFDAIGFSPFGIEDFLAGDVDEADASLLSTLNIEQSGFVLNGTGPYLARSYALLGSMLPVIHRYRGTGAMTGFVQQRDKGCMLSFAGCGRPHHPAGSP